MACPCGKGGDEFKDLKKLLKILLVEDDEGLRKTLIQFFASQGFNVLPAGSGTEAIDIAMSEEISFSIMDVNLPGLNGIDAFKLIRRDVRQFPCIFMSGENSLDVLQAALNAGAFTFIHKPIQMDLMKKSVDRLLIKFFQDRMP